MPRIDNWDSALNAALDAWADRPFAYGEADCARFVAEIVAAITGQDFYAPYRGQYASAAQAARALRRIGGGNLQSVLTKALGATVPPAFAARGDVVMIDGNAGICVGVHSLFVGDRGLESRPTLAAALAWKV